MAKILVVDDDKGITDLLDTILKYDGYTIYVAHDGEEALNLCGKIKFDLIITDIIMPKKDGIDFIIEMTKSNDSVPIIAMSGGRRQVTSEFNLQSASYLGVKQTLKKPFTSQEIRTAVKNALES